MEERILNGLKLQIKTLKEQNEKLKENIYIISDKYLKYKTKYLNCRNNIVYKINYNKDNKTEIVNGEYIISLKELCDLKFFDNIITFREGKYYLSLKNKKEQHIPYKEWGKFKFDDNINITSELINLNIYNNNDNEIFKTSEDEIELPNKLNGFIIFNINVILKLTDNNTFIIKKGEKLKFSINQTDFYFNNYDINDIIIDDKIFNKSKIYDIENFTTNELKYKFILNDLIDNDILSDIFSMTDSNFCILNCDNITQEKIEGKEKYIISSSDEDEKVKIIIDKNEIDKIFGVEFKHIIDDEYQQQENRRYHQKIYNEKEISIRDHNLNGQLIFSKETNLKICFGDNLEKIIKFKADESYNFNIKVIEEGSHFSTTLTYYFII